MGAQSYLQQIQERIAKNVTSQRVAGTSAYTKGLTSKYASSLSRQQASFTKTKNEWKNLTSEQYRKRLGISRVQFAMSARAGGPDYMQDFRRGKAKWASAKGPQTHRSFYDMKSGTSTRETDQQAWLRRSRQSTGKSGGSVVERSRIRSYEEIFGSRGGVGPGRDIYNQSQGPNRKAGSYNYTVLDFKKGYSYAKYKADQAEMGRLQKKIRGKKSKWGSFGLIGKAFKPMQTLLRNPKRGLTADPISAHIAGAVTGKDYKTLTTQFGRVSKDVLRDEAQALGYTKEEGRALSNIAASRQNMAGLAVATVLTAGAAGGAMGAAGSTLGPGGATTAAISKGAVAGGVLGAGQGYARGGVQGAFQGAMGGAVGGAVTAGVSYGAGQLGQNYFGSEIAGKIASGAAKGAIGGFKSGEAKGAGIGAITGALGGAFNFYAGGSGAAGAGGKVAENTGFWGSLGLQDSSGDWNWGNIAGTALKAYGAYSAYKGGKAQQETARQSAALGREAYDFSRDQQAQQFQLGKMSLLDRMQQRRDVNMERGMIRDELRGYLGQGMNSRSRQMQGALLGLGTGKQNRRAMRKFQKTPGYQFRMEESMRGAERGLAGVGGSRSGRAAIELQQRAGGLAGQYFDNYIGQLGSRSQQGMGMLSQMGQLQAGMVPRADMFNSQMGQLNPGMVGQAQSGLQNLGQAQLNYGGGMGSILSQFGGSLMSNNSTSGQNNDGWFNNQTLDTRGWGY